VAFEKTKENKVVSMMVGRLVACGVYMNETDETFAKLLKLPGNLKPGTITHYVNDGRKSEYDRDFSFLPWIENYCNAHRPKTSA
jgi:hypothetical protein